MTTVEHATNADSHTGPNRITIAIDGPSGAGKSSTARGVAARLGLRYLDTGAMFRAVAIAYHQAGLTADQAEQTAELVKQSNLEISTDPDSFWIRIAGRDVTEEIRQPHTSAIVSQVAQMIPVRDVLKTMQQDIIADGNIVAEGRDITTVIAPDAELRILLVADPHERIRRREAELGGEVDTAHVTDQVIRRDRDDSTVASFLTASDGVYTLDSTQLSLEQVIDHICQMVDQQPDRKE